MLKKHEKGMRGESVACVYLKRHGFDVIARNYRKKWGEIDIIARREGALHFFEVKSVTVGYSQRFMDIHRPEDNVHAWKRRHIGRMIETYLAERGGGPGTEFLFHVLCVYMDWDTRRARVKWVKNIIL